MKRKVVTFTTGLKNEARRNRLYSEDLLEAAEFTARESRPDRCQWLFFEGIVPTWTNGRTLVLLASASRDLV